MMSCPPELDKTLSQCTQDFDNFDTGCVSGCIRRLQDQTSRAKAAPDCAGARSWESRCWHFGLPGFSLVLCRCTSCYNLVKACINVLLSSKKLHLRLLKSMADAHGKVTAAVFARCTYRSATELEATHNNYILLEADFKSISDKLVIKTA